MLILEGFRFVDRLGKVDSALEKDNNINDSLTASNENNFEDSLNSENSENSFIRDKAIPQQLRFSQIAEINLTYNETKTIKNEFEELNNKLINSINSNSRRKVRHNLPKKMRDAILNLKKRVKDKVLDIRKVDKGQVILIIDYCQRIKAEELNISDIAKLCDNQSSNWRENKEFGESIMKDLYVNHFASKNELTAVTGLIAGGLTGKLTNTDGSVKYTRAISSSELYSKQSLHMYTRFLKCTKYHLMNFWTLILMR